MKSKLWLKPRVFEYAIFPQLPSFCGVAACCGALGAILDKRITEQSVHQRYQVGLYTKLQAPATCSPDEFAGRPRVGLGFSNWDVIRLFNAVMLDEGRGPGSAVLCGADFVRETAHPRSVERLLDWLQDDECQAIVHTVHHYTLIAAAIRPAAEADTYLVLSDSGARSGPARSMPLSKLRSLTERDERYGLVLLSDKPIPHTLFDSWTTAMTPPEATGQERFARINKS